MSPIKRKLASRVSNQVRQTRLYNHRIWLEALNCGIKDVEGSYYQCYENEGADQLRGNLEADLRVLFLQCKKQAFSCCGSAPLVLLQISR